MPLTFAAFDVLFVDGDDLTVETYETRRQVLESLHFSGRSASGARPTSPRAQGRTTAIGGAVSQVPRTMRERCVVDDGELVRRIAAPADGAHALVRSHEGGGLARATAWFEVCLATDGDGFVLTDRDGPAEWLGRTWTAIDRKPGVFAAGDVRAGSVKRVAAAVGEGSTAVRSIHRHLAEVLA